MNGMDHKRDGFLMWIGDKGAKLQKYKGVERCAGCFMEEHRNKLAGGSFVSEVSKLLQTSALAVKYRP